MSELGPLAAALAKAQTAFPAITKSKTVSKGTFSFKYAPLDTILEATRDPLAANGLAVTQGFESGELVTLLLHDSGAHLSSRIAIPPTGDDVQRLGSAITYLRRYALQAMLGIAAEEDDDVERAGNRAASRSTPPAGASAEPTLVELGRETHTGKVAKGDGAHNDVVYHQAPDGHRIGFKLALGDGKALPQVIADGAVGEALYLTVPPEELLGAEVTVEGVAYRVETPGRRAYRRLMVERIRGPQFEIPAPEAPSMPMFDGGKVVSLDDLPF